MSALTHFIVNFITSALEPFIGELVSNSNIDTVIAGTAAICLSLIPRIALDV